MFVFGDVQVVDKLADARTFIVKDETGVSYYDEVFDSRSCSVILRLLGSPYRSRYAKAAMRLRLTKAELKTEV